MGNAEMLVICLMLWANLVRTPFVSLEIEISYVMFKERGNGKEGGMRDEKKNVLIYFLKDSCFLPS